MFNHVIIKFAIFLQVYFIKFFFTGLLYLLLYCLQLQFSFYDGGLVVNNYLKLDLRETIPCPKMP